MSSLFLVTVSYKVNFSPVLQAQAVALTVAQAFTVAFELWQVAKEGRHLTPQSLNPGNDTHTIPPPPPTHTLSFHGVVVLSVSETASALNQPQ